eukprot:m.156576 g.156576  ORF g.156576 m.156576 type:complete len:971 (+) comp17564_c0_seq3:278-3190(+)
MASHAVAAAMAAAMAAGRIEPDGDGVAIEAPPSDYSRELDRPGKTCIMTAGLRALHKGIQQKEQGITVRELDTEYDPGVHTNEKGHFLLLPPVPLLARRYRFIKKLGSGTFAVVIRAEDTFHPRKRHVAIKVVHSEFAWIGEHEFQLLNQLRNLDHQGTCHVTRCYSAFWMGDHFCVVFELLTATPLHHCLDVAAQSSLTMGEQAARLHATRKVAAQLLAALALLRRANLIHADIKPENVLLRDNDASGCHLKLADFGNALPCTQTAMARYHDDFEIQTLWYRAPEVLVGLPFDHQIDMWSLGCLLFQVFTGQPLVKGTHRAAVLCELAQLFGPLPASPFGRGKFAAQTPDAIRTFEEIVETAPTVDGRLAQRLQEKLGTRDTGFCCFLAGLLQFDPGHRFTPQDALQHEFLAPLFPFRSLFNNKLDSDYPNVPVTRRHQTLTTGARLFARTHDATAMRGGGSVWASVKDKMSSIGDTVAATATMAATATATPTATPVTKMGTATGAAATTIKLEGPLQETDIKTEDDAPAYQGRGQKKRRVGTATPPPRGFSRHQKREREAEGAAGPRQQRQRTRPVFSPHRAAETTTPLRAPTESAKTVTPDDSGVLDAGSSREGKEETEAETEAQGHGDDDGNDNDRVALVSYGDSSPHRPIRRPGRRNHSSGTAVVAEDVVRDSDADNGEARPGECSPSAARSRHRPRHQRGMKRSTQPSSPEVLVVRVSPGRGSASPELVADAVSPSRSHRQHGRRAAATTPRAPAAVDLYEFVDDGGGNKSGGGDSSGKRKRHCRQRPTHHVRQQASDSFGDRGALNDSGSDVDYSPGSSQESLGSFTPPQNRSPAAPTPKQTRTRPAPPLSKALAAQRPTPKRTPLQAAAPSSSRGSQGRASPEALVTPKRRRKAASPRNDRQANHSDDGDNGDDGDGVLLLGWFTPKHQRAKQKASPQSGRAKDGNADKETGSDDVDELLTF